MLVKICGITSPDDAAAVLEAGADFIGFIHYPPSKRHISVAQINEILSAVESVKKPEQKTVLVVADLTTEEIAKIFDVTENQLDFVQIHRELTDEEFNRVAVRLNVNRANRIIRVIRSWKTVERLLAAAQEENDSYPLPSEVPYLLELSHGDLPGGNGKNWDWSAAKSFCERFPVLLAGGIAPENAADAIRQANPSGIDLSSGVEDSPGKKNIEKVKQVVKIVKTLPGI